MSFSRSVFLKDTMQCLQRGSNLQPLDIESSALPQSHCAPHNSVSWVKRFMTFLLSADFFQKHSFMKTIRVSNILDPDRDRHSVQTVCNGLRLSCL